VADDRVASNLQSLEEFAQTMWFDCPAPGPDFGSLYRGNGDFPLALDAPFGVSGPMILDFGVLRALLSDWSSIQSVMSTGEPACLVLDYTRVMTAGLLCHPAPRRIEMIGLGGGSIAKFCHRYLPDCEMTVVEIDPEVLALRKRFAIPDDDARLRVICADGFDFVESDPGRPDVLMVDGFDHRGRPGRLASRVFYDLCRERLGESGILIVNICGGYFGSSRQIAKISASFDGQVLAVTDATRLNRIAFASCGPDFLSCAEMLCVPAGSNQYSPPRLSAAAGRIAAAARLLKARRLPNPAEV